MTVFGQLSGFDCAVVGELCPTTYRSADYTTGVFTEGEEFYLIVNIPQSFLQKYFRQTVKVQGEIGYFSGGSFQKWRIESIGVKFNFYNSYKKSI